MFRVLARALADPDDRAPRAAAVSRRREAVVLALALLSMLLGLVPLASFSLLKIGRPEVAFLP